MAIEGVGPYVVAFLTSFLVCWLDLHKAAGDKINSPVSPLRCPECLAFLSVNGLLATVTYFIIVDSNIDLFKVEIWSRLIPWSPIGLWSKAIAIGLLTVIVLRSKLISLRGNNSFGFDLVYTRRRDRCVDIIRHTTRARRISIRSVFRDKFTRDVGFIDEFAEILKDILADLPQTPAVKGQTSDVNRILQTKQGIEKADDDDSVSLLVDSLIKSAVEYGDAPYIRRILNNRLRSGDFYTPYQVEILWRRSHSYMHDFFTRRRR